MSTAADHSVEVRRYIGVFAALMVLTFITVGVSYIDMPTGPAVLVAIAIASLKAGLVVVVFMHLRGERAAIHWPLALTMVLFVGLLISLIWSEGDHLFGTRFTHAFDSAPQSPAAGQRIEVP